MVFIFTVVHCVHVCCGAMCTNTYACTPSGICMGAVRRGLMFNGCILANLIDDIVYMHFTQSSIIKAGQRFQQ